MILPPEAGSQTPTTRYLWDTALGQILARDSGGSTAWYLTDREGTVRDIANNRGSIIDHINRDIMPLDAPVTMPLDAPVTRGRRDLPERGGKKACRIARTEESAAAAGQRAARARHLSERPPG